MRHRISPIVLALIISFTATSPAHPSQGLKGDVNGDGTVNILDALDAANYVLQIGIPDEQEFWRADCNSPSGRCDGDSVVNILDIIRIVNILLGVGSCEIVDMDGNVYYTVRIGTQEWMAENLKVTHYRNGDSIANVTDGVSWGNLSTGAYRNYNNDPSAVGTYGRLYNWYAVADGRNIAPMGCHVATDEEWKQLEMYLGMSQSEADMENYRGTDEGGMMKESGTTHWNYPNTGATNESGFCALPGGFSYYSSGYFNNLGEIALFWSSTEYSTINSWVRMLVSSHSDVCRKNRDKRYGLSVRCVRDKDAPTASFTVNPLLGDTATIFNVDASGSTDFQDSTSALQVRWDWENDGMYDTDWSIIKTASHVYTTVGIKTVRLQVKDTGGLTDTQTHQVTVAPEGNTVTDIDGNVYHAVTIGTQVWMLENLKVTHYRNGDPIPHVAEASQWRVLSTGANCSYNNEVINEGTYGRLYNWYAVNDLRSLAPEGWHVPSDADWMRLETYLGMRQSEADDRGWRGTDEGGKMKASGIVEGGNGLWNAPNAGATNTSGFSGLPGGFRYDRGDFSSLGFDAFFWSSTEFDNHYVWVRSLNYSSAGVYRYYYYDCYGLSVRCVRDD